MKKSRGLFLCAAQRPISQSRSFSGVIESIESIVISFRTTEDITLDSGRSDRCPPIGTVGKSEFRVAGSTITVITPAGLFSGTVSNDGRFSIVTAVRGASYSGARSREWKGTITGSRIEGTHQLQAAGFICRDVFSAKK